MRSECVVRTRFILNILVGLDWGSQEPPWLRPWLRLHAYTLLTGEVWLTDKNTRDGFCQQ